MKNLFLALVAALLMTKHCAGGLMYASVGVYRLVNGHPTDAIMGIQFPPDGDRTFYIDANGTKHVVHSDLDGSSSFPFNPGPGSYEWDVGAEAFTYGDGSDDAYTHFTFNFSSGDPLMHLSNLSRCINIIDVNGGLVLDFASYNVTPSDGNLQRGTESVSGHFFNPQGDRFGVGGSASVVASLTPSNYPSCGIDLICSAQTWTGQAGLTSIQRYPVRAVVCGSFIVTIESPATPQPDDNQQTTGYLTVSAHLTTQLGSGVNGQNGAYSPTDQILTNNPYFPSYVFTNVPSGSLAGITAGDGVDYSFNFALTGPCLVQSITLPNCTNSLTVSVSNVDLGTFTGGQTVYFTNFYSGGASQFQISGNGRPLPIVSGLELPLALTFNSPTGAFTLTPQLFRIVAPVTDQSLKAGQDLTIQTIVSSEQPVHYQWQLEGNDLPDKTNTLLTIPAFTAVNAGHYRLKMQSDVNGQTQSFYSPESSVVAVSPPSLAYAGLVNGTNGSLQFTVSGNSAQAFFLQSSSDLQNWQNIATNNISTNGSVTVQVANNAGSPVRFIRTASPLTLRLGP